MRIARHNTKAAQVRQMRTYDKKVKNRFSFAKGALVQVRVGQILKGQTRKLKMHYLGPFEIIEVHQGGRYYTLHTGQKVNFERLRPWL